MIWFFVEWFKNLSSDIQILIQIWGYSIIFNILIGIWLAKRDGLVSVFDFIFFIVFAIIFAPIALMMFLGYIWDSYRVRASIKPLVGKDNGDKGDEMERWNRPI